MRIFCLVTALENDAVPGSGSSAWVVCAGIPLCQISFLPFLISEKRGLASVTNSSKTLTRFHKPKGKLWKSKWILQLVTHWDRLRCSFFYNIASFNHLDKN